VALFRSEDHSGVLFARRQRIWDDDGALFDVISVVDVNLMEDVEGPVLGSPAGPSRRSRLDEASTSVSA
jgi:hypothetical protein